MRSEVRMKSHAELIGDFNAAGINFVMTELDVAYAFINVAKGPYSADRKQHLLRGAQRALNQALSMRPRFRLTEEQQERFQRICGSVEKSLAGFASAAPEAEERKAA
jgi:hypothetical protein